MEIIDIYDENRRHIGQASRDEVHTQGWWHKTFQCWIIHQMEGRSYLLFQKRSSRKDVFPNLLDKSCGGHLTAGESVADGVRELEEELGLDVSYEDLISCGIIAVETQVTKHILDREFCHVFVYKTNGSLSDYQLQTEEVSGVYLVSLKSYFALCRGEIDEVEATGVEIRNGEKKEQHIKASLSAFTPVSEEYLNLLEKGLQKINRF